MHFEHSKPSLKPLPLLLKQNGLLAHGKKSLKLLQFEKQRKIPQEFRILTNLTTTFVISKSLLLLLKQNSLLAHGKKSNSRL